MYFNLLRAIEATAFNKYFIKAVLGVKDCPSNMHRAAKQLYLQTSLKGYSHKITDIEFNTFKFCM